MNKGCLSVLLLMLASCSTVPTGLSEQPDSLSVIERQVELGKLTHWQAEGRIGLRSEKEAISASLDWQQKGPDYAVSLTAVFGQRAMHVAQAGPLATLQTKGRETATGSSAEVLVLQHLGVRVPLAELSFWIRGLPGTIGQAQYDRFGRLHTLKYQDPDGNKWRAKIKSYNQIGTLDLPRTIEVTDGTYDIRILVSQWTLDDPIPGATQPGDKQKKPVRLSIPGTSG